MTRTELTNRVADDIQVSRIEADVIVGEVLKSIANALSNGESVEFRGFGSFRTRTRPARTGRNPRSGETVEIPAKTIPFFKPAKQLRDAVAAGSADDE